MSMLAPLLLLLGFASSPGDGDHWLLLRRSPNTVVHRVERSGVLHAWVESGSFDLELRARRAPFETDADRDSAGGRTPWLEFPVRAGEKIEFELSSHCEGEQGLALLVLREWPDSESAHEVVANVDALLNEASRYQLSQADHDAARGAVREACTALLSCAPEDAASAAVDAARRTMLSAYHLGDVESVRDLLTWIDAAMEGRVPPDCSQRIEVLLQRAEVSAEFGALEQGLALGREAVARLERSRAPDDLELLGGRIGLGQLLLAARRLDECADILPAAVDALERSPGAQPRQIGVALDALACLWLDLGRPESARAVATRALEHLIAAFGATDPFVLAAQNNLGVALTALGDHQAALVLYRNLREACERTLPAGDPASSIARTNEALQLRRLGDREAARAILNEEWSSARLSDVAPHEHRLLQLDLAVACAELGDATRAAELLAPLLNALAVESERDLAWRVQAQASETYAALGRSADALELARDCAQLLAGFHPELSPDLLAAQLRVGRRLMERGELDAAWTQCERTVDAVRQFLAQRVANAALREAESLQSSWSGLVSESLELLASSGVGARSSRAAACAFELSEAARSIGLAALRSAAALDAPELQEELARRRGFVASRARAVAGLLARDADPVQLQRAIALKEAAERELRAFLSANQAEPTRWFTLRADDVANALAADEAAIGYWVEDRRDNERLVAFVVRPGHAVQRVELGPLAAVRAACDAWRTALVDGAGERERGETLAQLVVAPLASHLAGARLWHLALDDALQRVPFDALPHASVRLGDAVRMCVTPSLGELALVRRCEPRADRLLLLGELDYDFVPDQAPASVEPSTPGKFPPLWETAAELSAVEAAFRARTPERGVWRLERRDGVKDALLSQLARASWVHLATHGYFDEPPGADGARAVRDVLSSPDLAASPAAFSPLALCGLALSGANSGPAGVLTAEELAQADLHGCRLVVVSACESNRGLERAGQGVASFQKALHAAGAQYAVTSLWAVDDAATVGFMRDFYVGLWERALSVEEALWSAKSAAIARRAPPRDWAGWVLSRAGPR